VIKNVKNASKAVGRYHAPIYSCMSSAVPNVIMILYMCRSRWLATTNPSYKIKLASPFSV
jgi:hypothetical protein